ncbi:hypothetical protein MXB_5691 [Myxobolus squamalis]|nr:hypothetical protein MXB_5691 [Myxobolus squamalis]
MLNPSCQPDNIHPNIYIEKMNKYNLAMSLIKSFEQNPNYAAAILEDLVNYKFLIGRFQALVKDYKSAHANLTFAFNRCPTSMKSNKELILTYLIPINLKLGALPTAKICHFLQADSVFHPIIKSINEGNLKLFKKTLATAKVRMKIVIQNELVKKRIYLIILELKKMVLRTLYQQT